jgi:hypothetical protein
MLISPWTASLPSAPREKDAAEWPCSIGQEKSGGAREDQDVVQPQEDATERSAHGRAGCVCGAKERKAAADGTLGRSNVCACVRARQSPQSRQI